MKIGILILVFLVSANGKKNHFECTQEDCKKEGNLVPYPGDCEKYYVCVDKGEYDLLPLTCLEGQYFDSDSLTCQNEAISGECSNACDIDPGNVACSFECPPEGTSNIVDIANNTRFYQCKGGVQGSEKVCLPGTCFDGSLCVSTAASCCSECSTLCASQGFFQNPCNCSSYYYCSEKDASPLLGRCDAGYFDEEVDMCLWGVCTAKCSSSQCA